jgi:flagellar biosynthetic protein FliS
MTQIDLAYRRTAAEAPGGLALLIALFDTLAGDLRRAAKAQRDNQIERRYREVRHAMLVVAHLESWVDQGTGGVLAQELAAFYASLRRKLIEAEACKSAELLEQQMFRVLDLREHWQQVVLRSEPSGPEILHPASEMPTRYPGPQIERLRSNWSA